MAAGLPSLPPPVFVSDADGLDPNAMLADMVTAFENATGRQLNPAQVEQLLIDLYAYRESLVRNAIQYAGQQNLLAFASFPMLDYLGQLVGVTRLPAQPAVCTIEFVLTEQVGTPTDIPAGTSVGSTDGQAVFVTTQDLQIPAGGLTGTVSASATVGGAAANGYAPGQVSVMISPISGVASAANTNVTADGTAAEVDDHLRARIQQAPNNFSSAGPAGAYRSLAMGVTPAIVDAQAVGNSPNPGDVSVYVLLGPVAQPAAAPNSAGIAGSTLLSQVLAALNPDTVRPVCDTPIVNAVTEVDYTITAMLTTYSDVASAGVLAAAQTAGAQLAVQNASRIQRDIVPSQWDAALSVPGVYQVTLAISANIGGTPVAPQSDGRILLTPGQWANCTAITLTVAAGLEHS